MASALSTFGDFVKITGPTFLTSATMVVNEAQQRNYILRRFLRGNAPTDMVQGGSTIKDEVMGDEQNTAVFYQPNATFTWSQPQVLTEWEIQWRFLADHMSWTDQDIELNTGGMSRSSRHQVYKKKKYVLEQRVWTSLINKMELQLFAIPRTANMEAATGTEPYSVPAWVNENTNGLFYNDNTPTGETAWTTKGGIDPATNTWWRPQTQQYTSITAGATTNIIAAFDDMYLDVRFVSPPTKQEYFENGEMFSQFIACSKLGRSTYIQLMRAEQDTYVTSSRQDPAYNRPSYSGIDIEYVDQLDTALLYENATTSSAYVSEQDAAAVNDGPRYYWLNGKYLRPIYHTTRYMKKHEPRSHPNQPFTTICPIDCWYNLACRSVQRQGIVYPSGAVITF